MPKPLQFASLKKIGKTLRQQGDFLFLLVLLVVSGAAVLIFYKTVYVPVYVPELLPPREPVFNTELYKKVIEQLESREAILNGELADTPRNPFGEK